MRDRDEESAWAQALCELEGWFQRHDREAGRQALLFFELQVRRMLPYQIKRTWPGALVEEGVQSFLERLLRKPLPDDVGTNPQAYLARAVRNHFIDLWRRRDRTEQHEESAEQQPPSWQPTASNQPTPEQSAARAERAEHLRSTLAKLDVADRVAVKLDVAAEWLTPEEIGWLAERAGSTLDEAWSSIVAAHDTYELTLIFDPEPSPPQDGESRRRRMERFRRRRARARAKLRVLLEEGPE